MVVIDPTTIPPVSPPTNVRTQRTAADEAVIMFEPQSVGVLQIRYYVLSDPISPDLVCECQHLMLDMFSICIVFLILQSQYVDSVSTTEQQPQVTISGLDACTSYWVTVTAINYCGGVSSSEAIMLGVKDSIPYAVDLSLGDATCSDWIKQDADSKIMDMEGALRGAGLFCDGIEIPCFRESQWQCSMDDDKKVTFQ